MVNGFHVGIPESYTQVGKESTSEHCHFTALQLRERIICVRYTFLINRRYCDQTPKLLIPEANTYSKCLGAHEKIKVQDGT
jgi:hypothetical protein